MLVQLCTSPPSPLRVSLQMGRVGPLDRWPDPQNSAPEGLWVDPYNFRVKRVQEPVHPGSTRNRLTTALRRGDALLSWIEAAAAASGWGDAPPAGSRARGGSGGGGFGFGATQSRAPARLDRDGSSGSKLTS